MLEAFGWCIFPALVFAMAGWSAWPRVWLGFVVVLDREEQRPMRVVWRDGGSEMETMSTLQTWNTPTHTDEQRREKCNKILEPTS